jgi:hypothetical protein
MKRIHCSAVGLALATCLGLVVSAAVPPPEQLLPADTMVLVTAPDWAKVEAVRTELPITKLWNDAALRPLREKFMEKLTKEVIEPLERGLGFKCADYAELAQGQVTIALTQNGWTGSGDPLPGVLLLLDAKDKSEVLKKHLGDLKKKLAEGGKNLKTEKVRDVEITTVTVDLDELGQTLSKVLRGSGKDAAGAEQDAPAPKAEEGEKARHKVEVSFGQADALLAVGTSAKDLEKVLARLAGGSVPSLGDQPVYGANHRGLFREALTYVWVDFAPFAAILTKPSASEAGRDQTPMGFSREKLLGAAGVNSLRSIAMSVRQGPQGGMMEVFLGLPEDARKGIFKLLAIEAKEAGVPPFVPADAVQFNRWRLDGQRLWAGLEAMVNEISPGLIGVVLGQIEGVLKEKDPAFDFRKNVVDNLGDDVIVYQKAPRGPSLAELDSPPSLFLIGSPRPEQLLQALRALVLMPPGPFSTSEFKEREFLGRKIYGLPLPASPQPGRAKPKDELLQLTASGGYLVITTDTGMIEDYLRSSDAKPKPLLEAPGLAQATQEVGGSASGMFGYQNDVENMRAMYEVLKTNADALTQALGLLPVPAQVKPEGGSNPLKAWVDFSLLPPFEKVAKYFHFTVYAGRTTAEGINLKVFTPTPPQMNQ